MRRTLVYIILITVSHQVVGQVVPAPTGLSAKYVETDSANYISLQWDTKNESDSVTTGYNLLVNYPPKEELLISGKVGVIYTNSYLYLVQNVRAATYKFAVMGFTGFPKVARSEMSNVVEVTVPSQKLPFIEIGNIENNQGTVSFSWRYPDDIVDLEGFNLYMNGSLKTKIPGDKRAWKVNLTEKGKYIFQLAAFTASGLESPYSQKRLIKIDE